MDPGLVLDIAGLRPGSRLAEPGDAHRFREAALLRGIAYGRDNTPDHTVLSHDMIVRGGAVPPSRVIVTCDFSGMSAARRIADYYRVRRRLIPGETIGAIMDKKGGVIVMRTINRRKIFIETLRFSERSKTIGVLAALKNALKPAFLYDQLILIR